MQAILTLNSGSSSIKFAVFTHQNSKFSRIYSGFKEFQVSENINVHEIAIDAILKELQTNGIEIIAAGHRVVHGAMKYRSAIIIMVCLWERVVVVSILVQK